MQSYFTGYFVATDHHDRGKAASERFDQFGKTEDIDEAIDELNTALSGLSIRHWYLRPPLLVDLGIVYRKRFRQLGESKDIELAIKHHRKSVDITPEDSTDRPMRLSELSGSFCARFEQYGDRKDADSAINNQNSAVELTTDNIALAERLGHLGELYRLRYERFGDVQDIALAVESQQVAVDMSPPDSSGRADRLKELGDSFLARFGAFSEVEGYQSSHRATAGGGGSYANRRFGRFGHVKDIDSAIELQQEASKSLTVLNDTQKSKLLMNLGNSFLSRFQRLDQKKDIDSAIQTLQDALDLCSPDSSLRIHYLHNISNSLRLRFRSYGDIRDLDLSLKYSQQALELTALDAVDRPILLDALGTVFSIRVDLSKDTKDADAAVDYYQQALDLTPGDSPTHAERLRSLSVALTSRFHLCRHLADIDLAIQYLKEAIALVAEDSVDHAELFLRLGEAFMERCAYNHLTSDSLESVSAYRQACLSSYGLPITRMDGALKWARQAYVLQDHASAAEAYTHAINILPTLAWVGLDAISRLNRLHPTIQTLATDAAACMISLAETTPPDGHQYYLGRAIELLDQGRSILWSQTSNLRQDVEGLRAKDPELAEELDSVGRMLSQSCFLDADRIGEISAREFRRSAEKWEETVARVRQLRGFENALLPLPYSKLQQAARDGPIIILNNSQFRCDALIMQPTGAIVLVPLQTDVADKIRFLAGQVKGATREERYGAPWKRPTQGPDSQLQEALKNTWLLLGEPIIEQLRTLGILKSNSSPCRVWWCLTGQLAFLPMHACQPPAAPGMMDFVVSSYTPTIAALLKSQQRASEAEFRLLAIGQSATLPSVQQELAVLRQLLPPERLKVMEDAEVTAELVSSTLPKYSWVHFACHGVQDPDEPMNSGLVMYDQRLVLSKLAQSTFDAADFAFLSSCQSATGSKILPDESVHLAAGLQFVGFRGVIGTMWSINDTDAYVIAELVYAELLKDGAANASALNAAVALNRAVRHLRGKTKVPMSRWVPFIHFGL